MSIRNFRMRGFIVKKFAVNFRLFVIETQAKASLRRLEITLCI